MTGTQGKPSFAIVGAGGVGGYFGAKLAQAGYAATLLARGEHLKAIREGGLHVEGAETFNVDMPATDDAASIGPVDYVLIAVKLWDTEQAAEQARPLVGPQTAVISLQNGVSAPETVGAILGQGAVMGGVAEISASIVAPGRIGKHSQFARIRFGELDGTRSARAQALADAFEDAGIAYDFSDRITLAIWEKFIFLTGLSALTALTRRTVGEVRTDPDTRALLREVMDEVAAVGRASGVALADDVVEAQLGKVDALLPGIRASMAGDLAAGRRLELPWLSGAVVKRGEALELPTPANRFVYAALKLDAGGR